MISDTEIKEYINELTREVEFCKKVMEICEKESNYYTIGELVKRAYNKLKENGE